MIKISSCLTKKLPLKSKFCVICLNKFDLFISKQIYNFQKQNFSRYDTITNEDIKKRLKDKWEKKHGITGMPNLFSNKNLNTNDESLKEFVKKYSNHVNEREKRRLNFNRKDRWQQREIDDVMKNFDVKSNKFKDLSVLVKDAKLTNLKSFNSIEEIYFYLDELFKNGMLETEISLALDVFIKDINFFKEDDLQIPLFKRFISELSQQIFTFSGDENIYKAAKFLDWYNIENKNCWYNLERIIINKKDKIKPDLLLKTLDHISNQNEGTMELYDLYQYLFWSEIFDKCKNPELISLGYNMFITEQGYDLFYYDFNNKLLPRISHKDSTFDLMKIIQTFSEYSEIYGDIYNKIEEIILSRYEQLDITEASIICCGFAVAKKGSDDLYKYLEKIIISKFNNLDSKGVRECVRGFIISGTGSSHFFQLIKFRINNDIQLFDLTELVYILKCFYDRKEGDNLFYKKIEENLEKFLKKPNELSLEDLCTLADGISKTKVFSRDFQKVFEAALATRSKDIMSKPKISKFLFNTFYESGMCSVGLMNLLFKTYSV